MKNHIFIALSALILFLSTSCIINNYYNTPADEPDEPPKLSEDEVLLSFDTNGGSKLESIAVPKNKKLNLTIHFDLGDITNIFYDGGKIITPEDGTSYTFKNPTKEGKIIAAWCEDASGTTPLSRYGFTLTENTTIYAKWLEPCEITLDADGGTCSTSSVTVPKGNTVYDYWIISEGRSTCFVDNDVDSYYKIVHVPTKEGKEFAGWFRDPDDETTSFTYPKTFYASAPFTLKAKWADPCTIHFHTNCDVDMPDVNVPQGMKLCMYVNGDFSHELRLDGNSVLMRVNNNSQDPYPVKAGMRITAWYFDEDFTQIADGTEGHKIETAGISEINLFAKWE